METFQNKTVKVLVADSAGTTRLMMSGVLRGLGFAETIAVSTLSEALTHLTSASTDKIKAAAGANAPPGIWLISSLYPEDKVNALHLLALARQHPELGGLRMSLFVSAAEDVFLKRAFELGLLSFHRRPFNKSEFSGAIEAVLAMAEIKNWNDALTAATYLRAHLRAGLQQEALLQLETALVRAFPAETALLLSLAEAHFEVGDDTRARALLWQAEQREPILAPAARELGDQYLGEVADRQWDDLRPGVCVVVDPDAAAAKNTAAVLVSCGAMQVHTFKDGEAAWDWLRSNEAPELVILEWRIPKVTGPNLVQRMRSEGLHLPVVIVNSSLVTKKDLPLLQEMGVTTVLEKPTRPNEFLNCIAWSVAQARKPTERISLEMRIRAHLGAKQVEEAASLMQVYVSRADVQDVARRHLEAEFAFRVGDFSAARALAMASLQLGGKSVVVVNLLGKSLVKLGDFKAALQVFERAEEISPNSIERLCAMAETQCALGADESALEILEKAVRIDEGSQTVINSRVNVALATGNAQIAAELFDKVRPSDSVLAYINNRAVAYAKVGNFTQSIDLYRKVLDALPPDKGNVHAIVLYNLALTQIQLDDTPGALKSLRETASFGEPNLRLKINSLIDRADAAVKAGKPMKLNQRDAAAPLPLDPAAAKFAAILRQADLRPQVAGRDAPCLGGIYEDPSPPIALVDALLENPPRFSGGRG